MAYNANIPQSTDLIADSQADILANFQEINTYNSVNHVAFNDADQGKHKFMQMPEQGSAPTTAVDEGALYTKEASGATELFFRRENNGAEIQLTGNESGGSSGYVYIGNVLVQWGQLLVSNSTGATLTFGLPFPSAVYSIQFTNTQGGTQSALGGAAFLTRNVTTSGADVYVGGAGTLTYNSYWMAIGE